MNQSTILRRTEAGEAEVAAAAHGLSLTQRRFLTLLDTSCSVDQLLRHHPAAPEKFERDIARLAQLRLIAVDTPAASNESFEGPSDPVRLFAVPLARRLSFALVPLVAGALAWIAWHRIAAPPPVAAGRPVTSLPRALDASPEIAPTADPVPIATRVLKGDANERTRDARPGLSPARVVEAKSASESSGARPPPASPATHSVDASAGSPAVANDAHAASSPKSGFGREIAPIEVPATTRTPLLAMPTVPAITPGAPSEAPAPAAAPVPPAPPPQLLPVSRVAPDFPREALALGLTLGDVKARLTVDASGSVVEIEILEASHRTFDRAVRDALSRWRFEPGASGRTTTVDVAFKRD